MEEPVGSDEIDLDINSKTTTERNLEPDEIDSKIDQNATNKVHHDDNAVDQPGYLK